MRSLLLVSLTISAGLGAQVPQPQLLLDINPTSTRYSQSSNPEGMTADHNGFWRQDRFGRVGSHIFLSARVTGTGRELYYASSAAGSAQMAADINPGSADSNPSNFLVVAGKLYFTAEDGTNGYQVWEATVVPGGVAVRRLTTLSDTASATAIGPMIARKVGNTDSLYFTKLDTALGGHLIHKVELPGGSVVQVSAPLSQHWSQPVVLGDQIVFEGTDFRGTEAWWLDSIHNAGVLRDYNAGSGNCDFPVVIGDTVYFAAFEGSWGIYSWDRQSPVMRLGGLPAEWWKPVVLGTKIVFLAGTSVYSIDTAAHAPMVVALPNELAGNTFKSPYSNPVVMGGKVYYYGYSMVQPVAGYYLFESDGMTAQLIPDTRHSSVGSVWEDPEVVNDALIFCNFKSSGAGFSLYTFDGNALSRLQINRKTTTSANPSTMTEIDGLVVFSADDSRFGYELWSSDGTQDGTALHTNIATQMRTDSSHPRHFAAVGRRLMFAADDGVHGMEPWITDGKGLVEAPQAGTRMVADLRPGPSWSNPQWFSGLDGVALFSGDDGTGAKVWSTDGLVRVEEVDGVEEEDYRPGYTFYSRYSFVSGEDDREPLPTTSALRYFEGSNEYRAVARGGGIEKVAGNALATKDGKMHEVKRDGSVVQTGQPQTIDTVGGWLPLYEGTILHFLFNLKPLGNSAVTDAPALPSAGSYNTQTQATEIFITGSAPFDNVFWQPFPVAGGAAFLATVGSSDFLHWTDGTVANTAQISTTPIYGLAAFQNTMTQRESLAVPLGQTEDMIAFAYTDLGIEVWRVDGTSATRVGTIILDDVAVAIPLGGHRVAFVASSSATGFEVFVTDGTQIDNISEVLAPGGVSGAEYRDAGLWAMDGRLYFNGTEPRGMGNELYTWDAGALAQPYGVATSDGLRLRSVDPVIGAMAQFRITGASVTSSLGLVVFAPPAEPFEFLGEWVYLDLASADSLGMPLSQGTGTLQFPIPNDLSLIGARLDIQAVVLPYPSLLGAGLTRAQSLTIGG